MGWHGAFEALAMLAGFQLFLRARRRGGDALGGSERLWVLVGAAAGALLGARGLGLLEHRADVRLDASLPLVVLSTKSIVGGLLGGWIGVELAKRRLGIARSTGDALVEPLLVAIAIGRVGCHLAGVHDGTHGVPTDCPWALDLGDGVRRHPTALYEIAFLACLGVALRVSGPAPEGTRFTRFLGAYLAFRVAVEFLKPVPPWIGPFSAIQVACLAGLVACAARIVRARQGGAEP